MSKGFCLKYSRLPQRWEHIWYSVVWVFPDQWETANCILCAMKCDSIQWKLVSKLHCSTLIKLIPWGVVMVFPVNYPWMQVANLMYSAALMVKTAANRIVFHSEFPGALEELSCAEYCWTTRLIFKNRAFCI